MSRSIDISETHKEIVQAILREHLTTSCHVWVFGSRATWLAKEYSDLDLAIARKDGTPLSLTVMSALETAFEDSLLPWKVDVIDLHSVSEEFRAAIERDKVLFSFLGLGVVSKVRTLGEVIITNDSSYSENEKWTYINYLDTGNITENRISEIQLLTIGKDKIPSRARRKVQKGDIVYSTVRPNQKHFGLIKNPKNLLVSTGFVTIRAKYKLADTNFIYWFLSQQKIIENLQSLGEQSVSAYPSIKPSDIEAITINLPSLKEQKAIAHILGTLDDKIELNRQTNQTLEAMAQALFQSWFVDFDPVIDKALAAGNEIPEAFQAKASARQALGDQRQALPEEVTALFPDAFVFTEEMGWVPEGWESKKLSNLLEIKYGKDHKKLGEGDIPVYGSGGLMRNAEKSLYTGESVLIPRKGTLSNILYVNEAFWTVDTMFYTIPKHPNIAKYAFYQLKGLDFASMNVGSAVPSMTTKVLNELSVILPNDRVLKKFDDILKTYFKKLLENINQNSNLINLRDTLLPKLISGELRIADVGEFLAEVGV